MLKAKAIPLIVAALLSLGSTQAQPGQTVGNSSWKLDPDGRRSLILPDPAGDSQLVVPSVCWQRACPVVIVSHGRGGQASDGSIHKPFDALLDAIDIQGFVLLLSSDGGRETWGSPVALNTVRRAYRAALPRFQHDGRVYTLGISMGGLPATLTAYRRTLGIPVKAVGLVAGRVNLKDGVRTSKSRARSVAAAYSGASTRGHDPVNDFGQFVGRRTPLLVVSSPQDQVVSGVKNGLLLATLARKVGAKTKVIRVMGPHLNRQYVNGDVGRQIGLFFSTYR
ncbi:Alpha/beta hydrolase [Deinococcus saxicola]|uniref:alpha/beta hydrolase family protein n=1 Tax=Deinococcus saxicola TaxID=249406 RepID=UPI0039F0D84C